MKCVASLYDVYYKVTEVVIVRMDLRQEQEQDQEQEQVIHTSEKSVKGTAGLSNQSRCTVGCNDLTTGSPRPLMVAKFNSKTHL